MNNQKQAKHEQQQDSERVKKQRQIQQALEPFEDALIAQLPKPEDIIQAALERQKKQRQHQKKILSLLVLATLGGICWWNPVYEQHLLSTEIGEQKDYVLSDGSRVQLNTATQLQVAYRLFSRTIQLQQGEATFHVQHAAWHQWLPWAERDFNVQAGDIRIEDIGTIFNVRKLAQHDAQIAVVQGQVRVWSVDQQHSTILTTGQSISTVQGQFASSNQLQDVQQLIAWQKGYYYFNNQTLADVLAELKRYGDLPVSIQSDELAQLRISGQADLTQRIQLIHALPSFAPVKLIEQKDGSMVIARK
ncbi:FecR family protein [Acinetobacter puyangensis]|uniref:FecR family protein n=1 Tax=Acinetobacter puyangensis TaxID=1096779 RepID=UPI003A4DB782